MSHVLLHSIVDFATTSRRLADMWNELSADDKEVSGSDLLNVVVKVVPSYTGWRDLCASLFCDYY